MPKTMKHMPQHINAKTIKHICHSIHCYDNEIHMPHHLNAKTMKHACHYIPLQLQRNIHATASTATTIKHTCHSIPMPKQWNKCMLLHPTATTMKHPCHIHATASHHARSRICCHCRNLLSIFSAYWNSANKNYQLSYWFYHLYKARKFFYNKFQFFSEFKLTSSHFSLHKLTCNMYYDKHHIHFI